MTDGRPNNGRAAVDRSGATATTEIPAASPPDTGPREGPELTIPEGPLARWFTTLATEYGTDDALCGHEEGDSRRRTYEELAADARRIAAELLERGVEPGDRIAVADCPETMTAAAFLGVQFAGGVFVPVVSGSPPHRAAELVERTEPACLLGAEAADVLDGIDETISVALAEDGGIARPDADPDRSWPGVERQSDDLAAIVPTAGTTGAPVAPALTHRNVLAGTATLARRLDLGGDDILAPVVPSTHVYALVWPLACWAAGGTVAWTTIDDVVDDLQQTTPTRLVTVPRLYRRLYAAFERRLEGGTGLTLRLLEWADEIAREYGAAVTSEDSPGRRLRLRHALADRLVFRPFRRRLGLQRVDCAVAVGGPIDSELQAIFRGFGIPLLSGYGTTETAGLVTLPTPDTNEHGTVGEPLAGCTLRLADDGEALIAGPQVIDRYWDDDTTTRGAIIDGWFHSGDLGHWHDGNLRLLDRKRHMATLTDGRPVSPTRVEQQLRRSSIIADAIAIAEDRPHVTALLQPAFKPLLAWADRETVSITNVERDDTGAVTAIPDDVLDQPRIHDRFKYAVETANEHLAEHETIDAFHALSRSFRIDRGELTPLLEKRRDRIEEQFAAEIDALYD